MKRNRKAFTLVELIIVIVVIGILAGLAAPKFMGVQRDAKRAAFVNDIDVVSTVATLVETQRDQSETPYGVLDPSVAANKVTPATDLLLAMKASDATFDPATMRVVKVDPVKYQAQLGKNLKVAKLADLAVVLDGNLAGTVIDYNLPTGIVDGKGVEYFGIDIKK